MLNNKNFYPTPPDLIGEILKDIDPYLIHNILEPSAGKGDIVDYLKSMGAGRYSRYEFDIDCIELNPVLRATLKGKEYRVIHDDFLTFESMKKYDLVIMNPPFDDGDKHLLKALDLQRNGGQIICILNAETIKNLFSNTRKDLVRKLEEYNAVIEYKQGAFESAERKTGVEIALIFIEIPATTKGSILFDKLKKEEIIRNDTTQKHNKIITNDISGIVQQYNFEIKTGVAIIGEFEALKPHMLASFGDKKDPIIELRIDNKEGDLVNRYIKKIRRKYWETLFQSDKFAALFTEKLRYKFYSQIDDLTNYDFSVYNIEQLTQELSGSMAASVEATILELFETFSHKYNWWDETSQNIHYYNGWKTNQAWKINKKVIIPISGWFSTFGLYDLINKVADIEKVFNYLEDRPIEYINLRQILEEAKKEGQSRKIRLQYFDVTFYKKGTCHIEFRDMELLKKFNLFGSQRKGWLPPDYGRKQYQDMTKEQQEVIDNYEGINEYNKTLENRQFYFYNNMNLKLLGSK